jgi:hypothetical protein
MRKIFSVLVLVLASIVGYAQQAETLTAVAGSCNVLSVSAPGVGEPGDFYVTALFNDISGQWIDSSVVAGYILWDVDGNRFSIDSVTYGGLLDIWVTDLDAAGTVATGIGAIVQENDNYPFWVAGISQGLNQIINAHMVQMIGGDIAAGGGSPLTVAEGDSSPSVSDVTQINFDQADGFSVVDDGSGVVTINFSGAGTDNQTIDTLQLSGDTLQISLSGDNEPLQTLDLSSLGGGSGTDTSGYNISLNLAGTVLQLTDGDGTLSQDLATLQDGTGTDDQTITLSNDSLSIESGNTVVFSGWDTNASDDFSGSWNDLTNIPAEFADNTDNVGVDFTDSLTVFVTPTQLSDSLFSFSATDTSGYNLSLNLSGTTLQLVDGNGTVSQDLISLQDGTGTDDQNLAEVLGQGNSAGAFDIDMNDNSVNNIDSYSINTTSDDWQVFANGPNLQWSQTGAGARLSLRGATGTDDARLGVGGLALPEWELDVKGIANADTFRVDGAYYFSTDPVVTSPGDTLVQVWTDSTTAFFIDKSEFGGAGGSADGDGIYDGSGSLSGNTTVTMGGNTLDFSGNYVEFDSARIGIGPYSISAFRDQKLIIRDTVGGNAGRTYLEIVNDSNFESASGVLIQDGDGGYANFQIRDSSWSGFADQLFLGTGGGRDIHILADSDLASGGTSNIRFTTGGFSLDPALFISQSGNIGVGNTNPGSKLVIEDASSASAVVKYTGGASASLLAGQNGAVFQFQKDKFFAVQSADTSNLLNGIGIGGLQLRVDTLETSIRPQGTEIANFSSSGVSLSGALDMQSNNLNNVAQLSIDATTLDWLLDGDGTTLDFRRGGTDYMRLDAAGGLTLTSGNLSLSNNDLNGVGNFQVGATTNTTNGSGDITVTHGHSGTPTAIQITVAGGGTPLIPVVGTVNGTTFTVRFYNTSGAAVTSTSVSFYWTAR